MTNNEIEEWNSLLEALAGAYGDLIKRLEADAPLSSGEKALLADVLCRKGERPGYGNRASSWKTIYRNMQLIRRFHELRHKMTLPRKDALAQVADEFMVSFKLAEKVERDFRRPRKGDIPLAVHLAQIKRTIEWQKKPKKAST